MLITYHKLLKTSFLFYYNFKIKWSHNLDFNLHYLYCFCGTWFFGWWVKCYHNQDIPLKKDVNNRNALDLLKKSTFTTPWHVVPWWRWSVRLVDNQISTQGSLLVQKILLLPLQHSHLFYFVTTLNTIMWQRLTRILYNDIEHNFLPFCTIIEKNERQNWR